MQPTVVIILFCVVIVLLAAVLVLLFSLRRAAGGDVETRVNRHTDEQLDRQRRDLFQQNEALRGSLAEALRDMRGGMDRLTARSSESQLQITNALNQTRERADAAARAQTAAVTEAVDRLQQSNAQKLEEMRKTVDEKLNATLNERLNASFQTVSQQLGQVYTSLGEMREISGGITALNRVLAGVKTRGTWAEAQLELILDQIIPGMYEKNYRPAEGRDAVEFAVRIPSADGGAPTYLPVDSKFPVEDYLRLCEAQDAGDADAVKAARRALAGSVLAEAKKISKYIVPPATTNFAVMYLATDALYAEVLASKEQLADRAHREYRVLIAGPSTVTALLSSLAMGFRTVALNEKADEVMKLLAAAQAQYDKFGEALERARRKLDEAGKSLDDASSRNEQIRKKLKGVGAVASDEADALTDG